MKNPVADFLAAFFPSETELVCLRRLKPKDAPNYVLGKYQEEKVTTVRRQLVEGSRMLAAQYDANKTRGVYFVVNSGGHDDKSISRFNAFFCEDDKLPIEVQAANLDAAPLPTSVRVYTRKSIHAYWLITGNVSVDEWRDIQLRLIAYFDADPINKNPSRVMRLPFFNHVRYVPADDALAYHPVSLQQFEPLRRYTIEEMRAAFPPILVEKTGRQPLLNTKTEKWAQVALEKEVKRVLNASNGTRNNTLNTAAFALGQIVAGGVLDAETVSDELERAAVNVGLLTAEARTTIKSGMAAGSNQPRMAKALTERLDKEKRKPTSANNSVGEEAKADADAQGKNSGIESKAARAVQLASSAELFHSADGKTYASVKIDKHLETWPLKSSSFKKWLGAAFWREFAETIHPPAIAEAMLTLEGRAA